MLMKNQKLCKKCLFGWCLGGNATTTAYCEYQLITGKKRVNTAENCDGYIKRERAGGVTVPQKMRIYSDLVQKGKAI